MLEEFELGPVEEILFPFSGTLTDWAYAAGWESDNVLDACIPQAKPELPEDFFTRTTTDHIRTAIFKIQTDADEVPSTKTYGSRDVIRFNDGSGDF